MNGVRTLSSLAFGVAAALAGASPARAAAECNASSLASILYVTDRQPTSDAQLFNGERALDSHLRARQYSGSIAQPVEASTLRPCSSDTAFFAALRKRFVAAAGKRVLIYVHGYYTPFVQAARDALAISAELKFRGPVVLYSWPSKVTSRLAYVNDESNAEWSSIAFRDLLARIEQKLPGTKVWFVTHSLGARFAADGMSVLRHVGCNACFGRAALIAADIDSDTLREEFARLGLCSGAPAPKPKAAAVVTLYVSNRDVALRQSQSLHGHQRAGQAASEMILCGGVDTIDVGYLKFSDKVGHTYQTDPRVMRDAALAFAGVSPVDPRRALTRVTRGSAGYYELLAAQPKGATR